MVENKITFNPEHYKGSVQFLAYVTLITYKRNNINYLIDVSQFIPVFQSMFNDNIKYENFTNYDLSWYMRKSKLILFKEDNVFNAYIDGKLNFQQEFKSGASNIKYNVTVSTTINVTGKVGDEITLTDDVERCDVHKHPILSIASYNHAYGDFETKFVGSIFIIELVEIYKHVMMMTKEQAIEIINKYI